MTEEEMITLFGEIEIPWPREDIELLLNAANCRDEDRSILVDAWLQWVFENNDAEGATQTESGPTPDLQQESTSSLRSPKVSRAPSQISQKVLPLLLQQLSSTLKLIQIEAARTGKRDA